MTSSGPSPALETGPSWCRDVNGRRGERSLSRNSNSVNVGEIAFSMFAISRALLTMKSLRHAPAGWRSRKKAFSSKNAMPTARANSRSPSP